MVSLDTVRRRMRTGIMGLRVTTWNGASPYFAVVHDSLIDSSYSEWHQVCDWP